ncbi:MAG: DUF3482 domain-containing protein [Burkholderiales bacterium]|nr:DUF3482 domain-containing protein [Burkholderiales bacterium]
MTVVTLALVSHTNAGKTTLARTLLARDVGEVRDAPHVTTEASAFTLIEAPEGDRLVLWDTPGFGDSARLARRLAQEGNPLAWFVSQVWDRFRDRAFFLTQLAVRTTRDHADVVLYLVNAAEDPADAGYLASELAVLGWMGKPVLALLNQTGPPREPAAEAEELARWRTALAQYPHVREVLALDAFARSWVQELVLFDAVAKLLPPDLAPAFARLAAAWRARRLRQFEQSMEALAQVVASAACARVIVPRAAMLRRIGSALGIGDDAAKQEADAAAALARRTSAQMREAMDALIALHELTGRAAAEIETRFEADIAREGPLDEGKAAAMGGVLSGAVTGLAADLAAGGLTFGAGMLTGALLGALGGAGVARAVNVARGQTDETIRWDDAFVERLAVQSLLRYLAVAHYGRGRGSFVESDAPAFWRPCVEAAVAARRPQLAQALALRGPDCNVQRMAASLVPFLREAMLAVLDELHPGAALATRG